ncbi:hypothetical protein K443DRAFT_253359 [Laccaria amethystina LaAM-08-1]|uniref:Uncharacterized protein n=1 Tax=Laccaria amethystina LaAM-08-1 TaxID=1095629 RepID=A0A0C9WLL7_9AGAR|nr:hypothetical protein K443DRAFT_253359 [Laccaria amethystina LaAM-08-1]
MRDDCWGLFRRSRASSHREWHRRYCRAGEVVIGCFCFWIGTWRTDASILVSAPLIYVSSKSQHFIFLRRSILVAHPLGLDRSISFLTATLYLCQMPTSKPQCELVSPKGSKAV